MTRSTALLAGLVLAAGRTFDGVGAISGGAGTATGTKVQLWACNGQSNQQWMLG